MTLFRELADVQKDWRVFPPRPTLIADTESKYSAAIEDPNALLVVAEVEESPGRGPATVVGMALGQVHRPSSFSDQLAVELSGVVVRPAFRGRGIGRALAEEIRRFAYRRGAAYVTLKSFAQNEVASSFWEKVGFAPRVIQMVAPALIPDADRASDDVRRKRIR
jgi:ribosomal protein S18 acetylase RimI-like enzyme